MITARYFDWNVVDSIFALRQKYMDSFHRDMVNIHSDNCICYAQSHGKAYRWFNAKVN